MIEYGTCVVAGVTPGKGGQKFEGTVPIFNPVAGLMTSTVWPESACTHSPLIRFACFMNWLVFWSMILPPLGARRGAGLEIHRWMRARLVPAHWTTALTPRQAPRSIDIGQPKRWAKADSRPELHLSDK